MWICAGDACKNVDGILLVAIYTNPTYEERVRPLGISLCFSSNSYDLLQ
jgi:hypothetical protein